MKMISFLLALISANSYAIMTVSETAQIYRQLVVKNNLSNAPELLIVTEPDARAMTACYENRIYLFTGMLQETRNVDEVARVLAHELGHIKLKCMGEKIGELRADRIGRNYLLQAGFDVCKGAQLIKRRNDPESDTHPTDKLRYTNGYGCK